MLVAMRVTIDPQGEVGIRSVDRLRAGFEQGVLEVLLDPLELGKRRLDALLHQMRELFLDLARVFFRAQFVDEDFDARLVLVVAPTIAIVDAQTRLGIGHQPVERDEFVDARRDHRRAAHPATHVERCAQRAVAFNDADADVVQAHGRAVGFAGDDCDLELARQIAELRMEARPLAQQLGIRARVDDLVRCRPGEVVGRDIANAIAAGLDGVHLDLGEVGKNVGRLFQLDPVVLDVLPRGEVPVSAVVFVRDVGQGVHLAAVQRAIGNGDAQHVGVQLEIQTIHQPQRLELVLGQLAVETALRLVAKFRNARVDHLLVVLVIGIHQITSWIAWGSSGLSVRSPRTVGPKARTRSLICAGRGTPACISASMA